MRFTQALVCCSLVALALGNTLTFDANDAYNLTWSFNDTHIEFEVAVATTGYFGLGSSPSGSMVGADIIIGWVADDGTPHLYDYSATANSAPTLDSQQDVTEISSSEADGITNFKFSRLLDTGDNDDNIITSDTTRLIYSWGSSDPTSSSVAGGDYHQSNRGVKSVYLLDAVPATAELPANAQRWEIKEDDVSIPDASTTYWCSFHKTPTPAQKNHMIAFEPIITPGNEGMVHHALIYACYGLTAEQIEADDVSSVECYTANMPDFSEYCSTIIVAWAIGGTTYYYPEDAGFPLGTADAPDYVMMEMHYDNPAGVSGRVDSSGLSLIYTETVRPNDVGVIFAGSIYGIFAPPGAESFTTKGICHSSCTKEFIPKEGITVFGYMLHAHLAGRAIKVDWFRNGKLVQELAGDKYYDFNYQENRALSTPITLLPGDSIEVTCTLNTEDRDDITVGGLGSLEEMCLAFLNYYPQQDIGQCQTVPAYVVETDNPLFEATDTQAINYEGTIFTDWMTQMSGVSWDDAKRAAAQKAVDDTSSFIQCKTKTGEYDAQDGRVGSYPENAAASNSIALLVPLLLASAAALF